MGRGLGRRLAALASAAALGLTTGSVVIPTAEAPPVRSAEIAGVVHQRDRGTEQAPSGFDRISRLRAPTEVATASDSPGTALPTGDTVIAPPPETFDAAPAPPPPPPPTLRSSRWAEVEPAGGTWALIIGINNYPGSRHDLRSAVADADDVNTALAGMGVPGDHRVVLRDTQANRATILAGLDWLRAHAGPDAVAVLFYAGHVRKLGRGVEAVVAADGGLLTDSDLSYELAGLRARRAWIGIAACYAGGFTELGASGRILTGAAPAHALAYENADFGRSYMVEYMVRRAMIQGRANQSVEAAFGFAHHELERDYPNRLPVQYDWLDGELDLRPPESRTAPPPPPPPDEPSSGGSSDTGGSGGSASDKEKDEEEDESDTCSSLTLIISCRDD